MLSGAAAVTWLTAWLVSQAGMTAWVALMAALLAVAVTVLTFLAASVPGSRSPGPAAAALPGCAGGWPAPPATCQPSSRQKHDSGDIARHAGTITT